MSDEPNYTYDNVDRRWACNRKKPYPTEKVAKMVAGNLRSNGVEVNAYACTFCGAWHIGGGNRR